MGAALAVCVCAPYLKDWEAIKLTDIRDNATLIDNSLHSFLIHIFGTVAQILPPLAQIHGAVNAVIKAALRGGFLLFLAAVTFRMWRNVSARGLVEKSVLVVLVLFCVVTSKFNAWYLGALLAPALFLAQEHWLRRGVILITCAELLSITFFKQAYMLNYFAMILVPACLVLRQVRREKRAAAARADAPPSAAAILDAPQKS
jgi:hypothetical protein